MKVIIHILNNFIAKPGLLRFNTLPLESEPQNLDAVIYHLNLAFSTSLASAPGVGTGFLRF